MLELIDNNIDMLKKANNLGKMLKIDAFIENNGEKWLWRIENWVHSYAILNAGFFNYVLFHSSKPCGNSFVTPSLLSDLCALVVLQHITFSLFFKFSNHMNFPGVSKNVKDAENRYSGVDVKKPNEKESLRQNYVKWHYDANEVT